jgi:hypothetical protein
MEGIELTPARVIAAPGVTHIRYSIAGRRPLVLDNRGRDEEPPPPERRVRASAAPNAAVPCDHPQRSGRHT